MSGALGRVESPDQDHIEKYPMSAISDDLAADIAAAKPLPAVLGLNWYTDFDSPVRAKDGSYWIGKDPKKLGTIRGGHCICAAPAGAHDPDTVWSWYNQGAEGACVGFGNSRLVSIGNGMGARYQAFWLYRQAQILEGDPPGSEGAQVRSGLEVLRTLGNVHQGFGHLVMDDSVLHDKPVLKSGISAYRWLTSTDDLLAVLGATKAGYAELHNSWGEAYPKIVRIPAETLSALFAENMEAAVATDR